MGRLSTREDRLDSLTIFGQWWLPENPERSVGGQLRWSVDGAAELSIAGGLADPDAGAGLDVDVVVHGRSDEGKRMTILGAYMRAGRTIGLSEEAIPTSQLWGFGTLLVGAHVVGPDETYASASLVADHLEQWAAFPPPTVVREPPYDKVRLEMRFPDSLEALCDNDRVTLGVSHREHMSRNPAVAEVVAEVELGFRPSESLTLSQIWRQFVTPMLFFLTIATGEVSRTRRLTLSLRGDWPTSTVDVYDARWRSAGDKEASFWEFLIQRGDIEDFGDTICRWIRLYNRHPELLLAFFATPYAPAMYAEESFTRTVHSLEAWHRAEVDGTVFPVDVFHGLIARVEATAANDAEREFLRVRLQHANSPTLKQRLDAMIELSPPSVRGLLAQMPKLTRKVVNTRNKYAHGLSNVAPVLSDLETVWATTTLTLLFYSLLLGELGFPHERAESLLMRSQIWKQVAGPYNVLLSR